MTADQENRLLTMLDAFEGGQTINDLPLATGSLKDLKIEVFDGTGDSKKLNLTEAVVTTNYECCGRYWDTANSTYKAAGYYGSLDMLRNLPSLLGLGCYLVQDDRSKKKLDPVDHYRFSDGSPAKLDGTMGQYMWCWSRGFWFNTWKEGTQEFWVVSFNDPIPGKESYYIPPGGLSALGGGVMDRTNSILCSVINDAPQFRGGGNQVDWDGTFRSQLGMVATALPYRSFSTYARKRGEGWDANWYVAQAVPIILFPIIFGTLNWQEGYNANKDANGLYQGGMGSGVTNMPSWDQWGYYPIIPTSVGVELGDACGVVTYNVMNSAGALHYAAPVPVFFGLKHPFGHIWKIVNGEVIDAGAEKTIAYVAKSLYAGCNVDSVAGLIKGTECSRTEGYTKKYSMSKLCGVATLVGGSPSTYFCDYFYTNAQSSQGLRSRLVGGSAYYGTFAGAFYSNVNDSWSSTNATVSSPLCYFEADPIME
jgi:hypothetical protein